MADAFARSNRSNRKVHVSAIAHDGGIPCSQDASQQGGTLTRVCFSAGGLGGSNVGYASASAGPGFAHSVNYTKGTARAGLGVAAAGDTAVSDSFLVTYSNTAVNQTTIVINGRLLVDGTNMLNSTKGLLRVLVYRDSAAADSDPAHVGAGAGTLFSGKLEVTKASHVASGGFSSGNFAAIAGANRYQVSASNLSKVVSGVVDTSKVVVMVFNDSVSDVPMSSPLVVLLGAGLLGGSALWAMRRRKSAGLA